MPYCAPSVKGAQCQAYSCEPSVRGAGLPAQPGISSLVLRGRRPGLISLYLMSCICGPPIWLGHVRLPKEIDAGAKSSIPACARSAETPEKREESGLWRCLNRLFRNAILRMSPGIVPGGALGRRKGPAKSLTKGFETMSRVSSLSSPFLLGFDEIERVLDRVGKAAEGYPPYNIERIARDGNSPERLRITLAVAGFTRDQLDVSIEESQLVIRGRQQDDKSRQYIHRGIAARQFQRTFVLADGMEVSGADLRNGLLSIDLVRPQPERIVKSISIKECE